MLHLTVLALTLLGFAPPAPVPHPGGAAPVRSHPGSQDDDEVAALLARIEDQRDEVPLEVIDALAEQETREAAEALIAGYDLLASVLMRREVLRALAGYDGVEGAQQPALQKLADVATDTSDPELRDEAVDLLGQAPALGRFFLRMIVDSHAVSAVRERAMLRHVETHQQGDVDDLDWYEQLFHEVSDQARQGQRGKDDEDDPPPRSLLKVRELALEQLAPGMKDARLVELAQEQRRDRAAPSLAGIRRIALNELFARESRKARKVAEDVFKDVTEPPENRLLAARLLFAEQGDKLASRFIEEGQRDPSVVPMALRMGMAEMLAQMDPDSTARKLTGLLKKAEGEEALFALRALGESVDPKLVPELGRLAREDDEQVRLAALAALGRCGTPEALEELDALLEQYAGEPGAVRPLVELLRVSTELRTDDPEWEARLAGFVDSDRAELRNATLRFLFELDRAGARERLLAALQHEDWSTRVTALELLAEERTREGTGAIVARMASESGFMLNRFAEALWSLTGEPFGRSADRWGRWWKDVGASFEPIGPAELARREADRDLRRQREASRVAGDVQGDKAVFFGVRVESKRVLFVLDVSGSMADPLEVQREGLSVRIDAAKRELIAALSNLDADTLFNLVVFSGGVDYWRREGVAPATAGNKDAALEFVERLGAFGGTNLYGALQAAFADRDVDTLIVLSDGQPAGGETDDPYVIRERVASWNEHRHVTIHAIALGEDLGILEWLAQDSGGRYVRYE